jgi:hypothetical protein
MVLRGRGFPSKENSDAREREMSDGVNGERRLGPLEKCHLFKIDRLVRQ